MNRTIDVLVLPGTLGLILISTTQSIYADECSVGTSNAKMKVVYQNSSSTSYLGLAEGTNGITMAPSSAQPIAARGGTVTFESTTPICIGKMYSFRANLQHNPATEENLVTATWSIVFTQTSGRFQSPSSTTKGQGFGAKFSKGIVTITASGATTKK